MEWVAWLVACLMVIQLAEHQLHLRVMHKKTWFVSAWHRHVVEHHGKKRTDINVDMPFSIPQMAAVPVYIVLAIFGQWLVMGIVFALLLFYSYVWTKLHRAMHGLEDNWLGRSRGFGYWCDHHLAHHNHPSKNLATVFPWMDALLGTKVRAKAAVPEA